MSTEIPHRIKTIRQRIARLPVDHGRPFVVVDTAAQRLLLCDAAGAVAESFPVSTSARGLGSRDGSLRTPGGFHRVTEKIGGGSAAGTVFRGRKDTGVIWNGAVTDDDLILTRILRLEGLEEGFNRGPGVGSFERCIYLHGTNREDAIGTPASHGCVRMRSSDIIRLFDLVDAGTVVFIDAFPLDLSGAPRARIHFAGILGSGMSALAQFLAFKGAMVSGSDRLIDSRDTAAVREHLEAAGCALFAQDGSGVTMSADCLCVSTAVEEGNPDIAAAREAGIPVVHRSDVLAAIVASHATVAVAGTSGKSTVTAMIFEFLSACGRSPSLVTGAPLLRLEREGLLGNAFAGTSDLLVVEADESDGTLVKYAPAFGVVLNISKDHKDIEVTENLFATFAKRCKWVSVNADDRGLSRIAAAERFGISPSATWRPDAVELERLSARVRRDGVAFELPIPGAHNAQNLCAALCVCEHLGCRPADLAEAVGRFEGVARRFEVTETPAGVWVVDDFAHNPAKIAAAVAAARGLCKRIIAVYQPHGFGPTRFLKNEYIASFREIFRSGDALLLLPIYYAGGTALRDITSADLIEGLGSVPFSAKAVADRFSLLDAVKDAACPGDCVLLMGARDPSLPGLAGKIIALFS